MNRIVLLMLSLLIALTIAIGLISCGSIGEKSPVVSTPPPKDSEPLELDSGINKDKNDEDKDKEDEKDEKDEEKLPPVVNTPVVSPPIYNNNNTGWTPPPPVYKPNLNSTGTTGNTDTTDKDTNITYSKAGNYTTTATYQNVTISSKDVKLSNKTINGNLTITKDVGTGNVDLTNVDVKGTIYVYGGGQNSIGFKDVTAPKMVVDKKKAGRVRLVASGKTDIPLIEALSGIILKETSLTRPHDGFSKVVTQSGNNLNNVSITLYDCDLSEIYALEETTVNIKDGCYVAKINGKSDEVRVSGDWDAVDKIYGDVDKSYGNGSFGDGGHSSGSSSRSRLSSPSGLVIHPAANNRLTISWNMVSRAGGYTVQVNGKTMTTTETNYTNVDITDLVPDGTTATLSVSVMANKGVGSNYSSSYYCNPLTLTNVIKLPAPTVTGTALSQTNNDLTVSWTAPVGISVKEYLVTLYSGNTQVWSGTTVGTTATIPRGTLLVNGTVYNAKIQAVPNELTTLISNPVLSNTYTYTIKLPAPQNLVLTYSSGGTAALTWDAVAGATTYEVFNNDVLVQSGPTNSASNIAVDTTKSNVFKVKAKGTNIGNSEATITLEKLAQPTGVSFSGTQLSWTGVTGITYTVNGAVQTSPYTVTAGTYNIISTKANCISSNPTTVTVTKAATPAPPTINAQGVVSAATGATLTGTPTDLSQANAGTYSFTTFVPANDANFQLASDASAQVTFTVVAQQATVAKPTATPDATKANYTISGITFNDKFSYTIKADLTPIISPSTPLVATTSIELPANGVVTTAALFGTTNNPADVASFTVTVTAKPIKATEVNGTTVTNYKGATSEMSNSVTRQAAPPPPPPAPPSGSPLAPVVQPPAAPPAPPAPPSAPNNTIKNNSSEPTQQPPTTQNESNPQATPTDGALEFSGDIKQK